MRLRPNQPPLARVARLILAGALLALPIAAPSSAAGVGPLPGCRLDDFLTEPRGYADGPITLVDHLLRVGRDYAPPDLMSVHEMGLAGSGQIRRIAAEDTRAMARAAAENGTPIGAWSAYRSFRTQRTLYENGVAAYGVAVASQQWARPGHSEHNLGLGVDFMTAGGGSPIIGDWSTTPAGAWMKDTAWEYGWVMSFPKGKRSITCFSYEPWHYRYVGREVARAIHDSGLTTREYLWANFTRVDPVTGEPLPSPGPGGSPTTSPAPPATAEPIPTVTSEPTAATPTPTISNPGGAGSGSEAIAPGVLLVALAAIALIAIGAWRRPSRR
jgi:D-alanyl-D-alanine carboxypeptidase